jgi:hypothetical protein
MSWFERVTGFAEPGDAEEVRSRLEVDGAMLVSRVDGRRWRIGEFSMPSLAELRERVAAAPRVRGRPSVTRVAADVRVLHRSPGYAGALFQVASQFNMLEMVHPDVVPEDGVTRYEGDGTQGPACAIAAGAATIYRNWFVPVGNGLGQTRDRQLDGLADVGRELSRALGRPVHQLWDMRNGYALCTASGLAAIDRHLADADETARDALRARLRIGLHSEVEVTDADGPQRPTVSQQPTVSQRPTVSQAFCAALPIAYSRNPQIAAARWASFARLVLEAAYEATLLAGILNAQRTGSNVVALTHVGGGAFGNDRRWIDDAIARALALHEERDLDVRIVRRSER